MTEQEFNKTILGIRSRLIRFAGGFASCGAATPEDMVQDAIMRVWSLNCKGQQIRNIEAISIAILKNICLDYIKLKKNKNEGMDSVKEVMEKSDLYSSPIHALEIKDKVAHLRVFIKTLPADQQVVLRLRDVMGYELEEIAAIMDTTEGNIRTMLSRARGKLRCYLVD